MIIIIIRLKGGVEAAVCRPSLNEKATFSFFDADL